MAEKREDIDFSAVQAKIAKELARVKAVRRHRSRPGAKIEF